MIQSMSYDELREEVQRLLQENHAQRESVKAWKASGKRKQERIAELEAENERLRQVVASRLLHDDKCESEFIDGAMDYSPCDCESRALVQVERLTAQIEAAKNLAKAIRIVNDGNTTEAAWQEVQVCLREFVEALDATNEQDKELLQLRNDNERLTAQIEVLRAVGGKILLTPWAYNNGWGHGSLVLELRRALDATNQADGDTIQPNSPNSSIADPLHNTTLSSDAGDETTAAYYLNRVSEALQVYEQVGWLHPDSFSKLETRCCVEAVPVYRKATQTEGEAL